MCDFVFQPFRVSPGAQQQTSPQLSPGPGSPKPNPRQQSERLRRLTTATGEAEMCVMPGLRLFCATGSCSLT